MKKALMMAAGLMLAGTQMFAHHGDAGRYNEDIVKVSGTVVDMQMVDPHSVVVFDAEENGKTVRFQAEMPGRGGLTKMGWTRNTVKPGDKVTVTGRRVKSGAPYMNLTEKAQILVGEKDVYHTENWGQ
ncbi:MAG: DUF6152 family protein [Bryobacteraceae bacterium]